MLCSILKQPEELSLSLLFDAVRQNDIVGWGEWLLESKQPIRARYLGHVTGY